MKSGGGKHRFQGSIDSRKERDEDLLLFRDLYRREEQKNVSLLQSDDFEATLGSNQLYRMPSAKRGGGYDLFNSDGEKSDYDWLKTPPMTPLFPSIEMEPFDQKILQYKEPSNLQPVRTSRFASAYREDLKPIQVQRPRSPSARSTTSTSSPGRRPGSSSGNSAASAHATAANLQPKPNQSTKRTFAPSRPSSSSSNSTTGTKAGTTATAAAAASKPWSHGASPRARTLASLPDEAPPNLITSTAPTAIPGRAASVTRGRLGTAEVKVETTASSKPRRQSLSPNTARGRRAPEFGDRQPAAAGCGSGGNLLVGSRMVEKMMNARKSAGSKEDLLDTKPKHRAAAPPPANDLAQYGRLMTRSSLDLAFKHMELRKGSSDNNQQKVSSAATRNPVITDQKVLTTPSDGGRVGGRRSADSKIIVKRNNIDGRHRFGLC